MKTRYIFLLLLTGMIISAGCTTLKRYSSVKEYGTNDTLADVDLFGFRLSRPLPGKSTKSLWDLSADAQSQYIKILNSRYPDNKMFINSLSFEYMKDQAEVLPDDYIDKELKLIFSVSRKRGYSKSGTPSGLRLSPADRIEYLKISLEILEDSCLRFTDWNKYTTEYASVDIADVSFTRSLDLEASSSIGVTKEPDEGNATAKGKSSVSRTEDQTIKYRYLLLNGRINERKIEMEEEGYREIDLAGNIIADVSLEFYAFPETVVRITGLRDSTGKFTDQDKSAIFYSNVVVPKMDNNDTIKAVLRMDYVYRNVGSGKRTFPEWDDRVTYCTGSVKKKIPLFTASDYVPDFYCIGSALDSERKDLITIEKSVKMFYPLIFRTYDEASAFYEWLMYSLRKNEYKGEPVKIGGQTLKFKGSDLTFKQIEEITGFGVLPYYY
jgi:hypothetical protein